MILEVKKMMEGITIQEWPLSDNHLILLQTQSMKSLPLADR